MSQKFSVAQQVEEVVRELALRERVYPRQVMTGKMRQSLADFHMARLRAVLETLTTVEAEVARAKHYDRMDMKRYLDLCQDVLNNIDRALRGERTGK